MIFNILNIVFPTVDKSLDPVVLLLGLETDQVHAAFPAVVSRIEPVPLGVSHAIVVVLPAEPVEVATELLHSALVDTCRTATVQSGQCRHGASGLSDRPTRPRDFLRI